MKSILLGAVISLGACSDGESGARDGGQSAEVGQTTDLGQSDGAMGTDGETGQIGQPLEFADRPQLTPCPEGWREVEHSSGVAVCDPWPEGGPDECESVDSAHFPGEAGCSAIGEPCPDGDWSENLPSDATIVYARPGPEGEGDGSREAPYGTLAEALEAAPEGAVIALAKGTYDRSVTIAADVTLWGACVAETVLSASDEMIPPPDNGMLIAGADRVVLRNLQVASGTAGVLAAEDAALAMIDLAMVGPLFGGVGAMTSASAPVRLDFLGRNLIFRDFRGHLLPERGAFGFLMTGGTGTFVLERAVLEDLSLSIGLFGKEVEMRDVALLDFVEAEGLGGPGESRGIGLFEGTTGTLERVAVLGAASYALFLAGEDTEIDVEDFISTGDPDPSSGSAAGISVISGATLHLSDAWIGGHRLSGVNAGDGAVVTLADVLIEDTDGLAVAGSVAVVGSTATGERIALVGNLGIGVVLGGSATVDLTDLVVQNTGELTCEVEGSCPNGALGMGISVQEASELTLTEFELTAEALCGFQLVDGNASLSEGVVRDNLIGVNIQVEGFDYDQIQATVLFVDNERNLDSASLPVPDLTSFTQVIP